VEEDLVLESGRKQIYFVPRSVSCDLDNFVTNIDRPGTLVSGPLCSSFEFYDRVPWGTTLRL